MARHDSVETTNKQEDALNAAQVEFTLNPLFQSPQKQHFLEAQQSIFDELEKFSSAWFQRRQDAAQAMISVSKQMLSLGQSDPANALRQVADWHRETMSRIAQDAKECTELMTHCAKALGQNASQKEPAETIEKTNK